MNLREQTSVYRCEDGSTVTVHTSYQGSPFDAGILRSSGDPGGSVRTVRARTRATKKRQRKARKSAKR